MSHGRRGKRSSFKTFEASRESVYGSDVLMSGVLKKKATRPPKRYQKRYFEVVGQHYLNYYMDESKQQLKGTLDMRDCVEVHQEGSTIVLVMYSAGGTKVKLRAATSAQAKNWHDGLSTLVKGGNVEDTDSDTDEEGGKHKKKGKKPLVYPPDRQDTTWLTLTFLKAKGLEGKDIGGSSDPYFIAHAVEPDVPKKARLPRIGKTSTIPKSLDPDWGEANGGFGEEVGSYVPKGCKILVECYDEGRGGVMQRSLSNPIGSDVLIGKFTLDLSTVSASASEYQWYELEKSNGSVMMAVNLWDHRAPDCNTHTSSSTTKDSTLPPLWASVQTKRSLHICAFHANANAAHGTCYPYNRVVDHVVLGRALTGRVLESDKGTPESKFANKHEVNCFMWYLLFKACEKRQEFVSGSWLVQDPGFKIMNALSPLSYTRKLIGKPYNKELKTDYDHKTFGSTHYIDMLVLMERMGSAHIPEDQVALELEKGGKSLGYYQTGIDIEPSSHDDGSIRGFGLFCEKAHVVAGKLPAKFEGGQWTFVKAEGFGTQSVGDQINHTLQLGKSVAGVSKGPKHLRGLKRSEHPDKRVVRRFCALVDACCDKPLARRLLRTDLTVDELHARAKVLGMSFMYPKAREVYERVAAYLEDAKGGGQAQAQSVGKALFGQGQGQGQARARGKHEYEYGGEEPAGGMPLADQSVAQAQLIHRQAAAWLTSVHEDPSGLDFLETRTGCEVILGLKEMDMLARGAVYDARHAFVEAEKAEGYDYFSPPQAGLHLRRSSSSSDLFHDEHESEEEEDSD